MTAFPHVNDLLLIFRTKATTSSTNLSYALRFIYPLQLTTCPLISTAHWSLTTTARTGSRASTLTKTHMVTALSIPHHSVVILYLSPGLAIHFQLKVQPCVHGECSGEENTSEEGRSPSDTPLSKTSRYATHLPYCNYFCGY